MLIKNANLITWGSPNQILADQAVLVENDRVRETGPSSRLEARYPQEEILDARGQLVMPGNICAHTHFYGAFARGMAIPGHAPRNFLEILEKLWWPLDKSLLAEDVRYSALLCLVDAVKHGTTTLFDHHASPNAIDGSLDVIAEAVEQAGLRACLCYEVTDRDGPEKMKAGIAESDADEWDSLDKAGLHPHSLTFRQPALAHPRLPAWHGDDHHRGGQSPDERPRLAHAR